MSSFSPYEITDASIKTMYALTDGSPVTVKVELGTNGMFTSGSFTKGRTTVKIEQASGGMDICVTPPAPFKCILKDPDSTRRTEMYYGTMGPGKFVPAIVCPRNDRANVPARIVFHVDQYQAADVPLILARIAGRF
jgi:hypothetical protein